MNIRRWIRGAIFSALILPAFLFMVAADLNAQDLKDVEALVDRYMRDLEARRPLKDVRAYLISERDFDVMLKTIKASPDLSKKRRSRFDDRANVERFRARFTASVRRMRNTYVKISRLLKERNGGVELLYIRRINMEERFGLRRYVIRVRIRTDRDNKKRESSRRIEILYVEGKLKIMRIFSRL